MAEKFIISFFIIMPIVFCVINLCLSTSISFNELGYMDDYMQNLESNYNSLRMISQRKLETNNKDTTLKAIMNLDYIINKKNKVENLSKVGFSCTLVELFSRTLFLITFIFYLQNKLTNRTVMSLLYFSLCLIITYDTCFSLCLKNTLNIKDKLDNSPELYTLSENWFTKMKDDAKNIKTKLIVIVVFSSACSLMTLASIGYTFSTF